MFRKNGFARTIFRGKFRQNSGSEDEGGRLVYFERTGGKFYGTIGTRCGFHHEMEVHPKYIQDIR